MVWLAVRMGSDVVCPPTDADLDVILEFALTYDAYRRLADSPQALAPVISPIVNALEAGDGVPAWAGLDLLRGSLFYLQRRTHRWGDVPPDQEHHMRTLLTGIQTRSEGGPLHSDSQHGA